MITTKNYRTTNVRGIFLNLGVFATNKDSQEYMEIPIYALKDRDGVFILTVTGDYIQCSGL